MFQFLAVPLVLLVVYVASSLRVLNQYERGVTFFLGRLVGTKGPGLAFVPTFYAKMKRISMRVMALDVPPQDVITRDNISVKVNAVLYFRVADPALAVMEIEDYLYATGQLSQTTLLSVLGQVELDELLADRRKVNELLKEIIDERTDFWGVEISAVEPGVPLPARGHPRPRHGNVETAQRRTDIGWPLLCGSAQQILHRTDAGQDQKGIRTDGVGTFDIGVETVAHDQRPQRGRSTDRVLEQRRRRLARNDGFRTGGVPHRGHHRPVTEHETAFGGQRRIDVRRDPPGTGTNGEGRLGQDRPPGLG